MPSKSGKCKCRRVTGEGEKEEGRERRKERGQATLQPGTKGVSERYCQKKWCSKPKDCAWEAAGGLMGLSAHYHSFILCKL